jgi:hypothetical protein
VSEILQERHYERHRVLQPEIPPKLLPFMVESQYALPVNGISIMGVKTTPHYCNPNILTVSRVLLVKVSLTQRVIDNIIAMPGCCEAS